MYALYTFLFLTILLSGCAQTKEVCKGVLGISTKVLEDGRKEAIKKEFNFDLITCHNKIRLVLKDTGSYIYCDDLNKDMLALYISEDDTAPVGVFLTEAGRERTLVEVSSPSTYAKERIAKTIFDYLITGIKKPAEKGLIDADKGKAGHKKSHQGMS